METEKIWPRVYLLLRKELKHGGKNMPHLLLVQFESGKFGLPYASYENRPATDRIITMAKNNLSIQIDPLDLRLVYELHWSNDNHKRMRIDLFFGTVGPIGELGYDPDAYRSAEWFPIHELPKNTLSHICLALTHIVNNVSRATVRPSDYPEGF